jgi:hypothetical protein
MVKNVHGKVACWLLLAMLAGGFAAGCESTRPSSPAEVCWEYKVVDSKDVPAESLGDLEKYLNQLGEERWELASTTMGITPVFTFKRPKTD